MSTNNDIHLQHQIIGNGSTNIVFLNGFRTQFKTWDKVYPEIASESSVILFNRRGVGLSPKATEAHAGPFPNVSIAVVSGAKKMPFVPEKAFEIHQQYQAKLLSLSPISTHYICHESGHFPQITEPKKVITAIRNTLNETTIS